MMTKRHVSLLEVLIALVLTIAVLMTLTFFYRQVTEIGSQVDQLSQKNFNMRYIESRLAAILPKAVSTTDKKRDFLFFSIRDEGITKPGSQSLIFTYNNNVSLNKVLSNHNLARIYLDKNGNLMIAYWPSPKRWEGKEPPLMKKEVLMSGVENLIFEFYIAPEKKESDISENEEVKENKKPENQEKVKVQEPKIEPEPKGDWRSKEWLQEYKQLPAMVRVIITMPNQEEPLKFVYPLANAKSHVIYK